jgi:hypothetical protein
MILKNLFIILIVATTLTIFHLILFGNLFHQHQQQPPSSSSPSLPTTFSPPISKRRKDPNNKHTRNGNKETSQDDGDGDGDSTTSSSCMSLKLHKNATIIGDVNRVELCWKSKGCSGSLKISISSAAACSSASAKISNTKSVRDQVLSRGPHQFRFRLDGPEVFIVPHTKFVSTSPSCEYIFDLPRKMFRLAGLYHIGLEMLFKNFAFLDDTRDVWPELLKLPLLPVDQQFVENTKYHLQQCTIPASSPSPIPFLVCDFEDTDPHNHEDEHEEQDKKIPCDGHTEIDQVLIADEETSKFLSPSSITSGTWRRVVPFTKNKKIVSSEENEQEKLVWTRVRVKKIRKEPILFEWALQSEPEARWWPRFCKISPVTRREIFDKFNGKRIVVSGDSQLRALYYAFANTVNGFGEDCVRNITTLAAEPKDCIPNVKGSQRKSFSFEGKSIQIDYIDDLFLNRIKQKLGYNYDVIIVGFAQHPASKEHWKVEKYMSAVNQRMAQLKEVQKQQLLKENEREKPKVIWYTAPHYPHTRQGYPVAVKDWRTDSRLEFFNKYSTGVARSKEYDFDVLDSFAISDAFIHTSPDQAHFSNFVAAEFVRMLFSILVA